MKIGYARVSTTDQSPELQIDALERAGCETVFQEFISGKDLRRPELNRCLEYLREGDQLIVWKLDRLGRSLKDLLELVENFQEKGIEFHSLTEGFDTTTPAGRMFFKVVGSIAEFERELNRERSEAGRQRARALGVHMGRPSKLSQRQIEQAVCLIDAGKATIAGLARDHKVSRSSMHNYIKRYRDHSRG